MLKVNRPEPVPHTIYTVGTNGVKKGQLCIVSSETAVAAAEAVSASTVLGIALDTKAAGAAGGVQIEALDGALIECDIYQGGATDTFSATDVGKVFDIYVDGTTGEMFIDPNDTTGGFLVVMSYDNAKAKAWAKILRSVLYLA